MALPIAGKGTIDEMANITGKSSDLTSVEQPLHKHDAHRPEDSYTSAIPRT